MVTRAVKTTSQEYPRINDRKNRFFGCLDDSRLVPHKRKIPQEVMSRLIQRAIVNANRKSSREILSIPPNATEDEVKRIYHREGKELFKYFKKYPGDPAASAHQIHGKNYRAVGVEQFRNRALQKERMNSGWRYQFLAVDCARESRRFKSVSDIGAAEADFNAVIEFIDNEYDDLSLYVSIKNRSNTMGGADWPKAIAALETVAATDKNRTGPYLCIFGMAMDRGLRRIKRDQKSNRAQSENTEVWMSDYFWPFFANYTYEEIMHMMLAVLVRSREDAEELPTEAEVPDELLDSFGKECLDANLLDELGNFNDPFKLVSFFCQK